MLPLRLAVVESPSLRLALRLEEAAAALGVSVDYFATSIRPELRTVRRGRVTLVSVAELEKWLDRSAARALEGDR